MYPIVGAQNSQLQKKKDLKCTLWVGTLADPIVGL